MCLLCDHLYTDGIHSILQHPPCSTVSLHASEKPLPLIFFFFFNLSPSGYIAAPHFLFLRGSEKSSFLMHFLIQTFITSSLSHCFLKVKSPSYPSNFSQANHSIHLFLLLFSDIFPLLLCIFDLEYWNPNAEMHHEFLHWHQDSFDSISSQVLFSMYFSDH